MKLERLVFRGSLMCMFTYKVIIKQNTMKTLILILTVISSITYSQEKMYFSVYFENDISTLTQEEKEKFKSFASTLKYYQIDSIKIDAFADSNASLIYNDKLSKRRLNYVVNQLPSTFRKVPIKRSFNGERKPLNPNSINYSFSSNRRADITVHTKYLKNINDFYKEYSKTGEVFKINPLRDTVIITSEGIKLNIKKNTFYTEKSDLIDLNITRYYSKSDIVLNNLNTITTEGDILESDGMMNIVASQNGNKLNNELKNAINLTILSDSIKQGMKLITGTFNEDSVHKWEWEEGNNFQSSNLTGSDFYDWAGCCKVCLGGLNIRVTYNRDSIYMTNYVVSSKRNYFEIGKYKGESLTTVENKQMKFFQRVFLGKKKKLKKKEVYLDYLKQRKKGIIFLIQGEGYSELLELQKEYYDSLYYETLPVTFSVARKDSIYTWDWNNRSLYYTCVDKCPPKSLVRYLEMDSVFIKKLYKGLISQTNLYKYDRVAEGKELLKLTNEVILLLDTNKLDNLINKLKQEESSLVLKVINQEVEYNEAMLLHPNFENLFREKTKKMAVNGEITAQEYVKLSPENNIEYITNYQFSLTQLGLVNIDALTDFEGEKRYDLKIKFKTKSNDYKLVLKDIKSVLQAVKIEGEENTVVFKNVPENQEVTLIGINYIDDNEKPVQLSQKSFTTNINDKLMYIEFGNKITMKQLQEELKSL
jgi:hypothetical protein